jgi:hypothetical protein
MATAHCKLAMPLDHAGVTEAGSAPANAGAVRARPAERLFVVADGTGLADGVVPASELAATALVGAAAGSATGTQGVIWAESFGVAAIGSIKGVVNATRSAATAAGAVVFAALAGPEGDYRLPLFAAATLAGVGLVGALFLPRSHRGRPRAQRSAESDRLSSAATESSP